MREKELESRATERRLAEVYRKVTRRQSLGQAFLSCLGVHVGSGGRRSTNVICDVGAIFAALSLTASFVRSCAVPPLQLLFRYTILCFDYLYCIFHVICRLHEPLSVLARHPPRSSVPPPPTVANMSSSSPPHEDIHVKIFSCIFGEEHTAVFFWEHVLFTI